MAEVHKQAGSGPVQKREVAVVKQEGGAGLWEGVETSPVERWVGRGSTLEDQSYSLGIVSSVVIGRKGISREKGTFVTGALAGVLPPWSAELVPRPTTMDQAGSVASWGWGCCA